MKKLYAVLVVFIILLTTSIGVLGKSQIILEKKSVLSNKVEILLPKTFTVMSEEMAKVKYSSSNRPNLIYTDARGTVNISFNHTASKVSNSQIPQFKEAMKKVLQNSQPQATWYKDGVNVINKKNVGYVEILTPAADCKIYNLMFFAELNGRALMVSFNCTEGQLKDWKPVGKEIMNSLKIK